MKDDLLETLGEVQRLIDEAKSRWASSPYRGENVSVYAALTMDGRPMLGDLLVTKANLLVALAAFERLS